MNVYYKSVGRGGTMLLNSTPNIDGLIPADDVTRYRELVAESTAALPGPSPNPPDAAMR